MSVDSILGDGKGLSALALFKPVSWMTKIDLINRLVLNNNVLMTVLAESGGGKSTFFKLLQSGLDTAICPVLIVATPLYEERHLLAQVALACSLPEESSSSLQALVSEINQRQQYVLLLIDDAQHLPMILIESLLEVMKQQGHKGYFHVCFASEYSLVETLNRLASGAYQNMIHGLELGPLSEQELRHYVTQYLPSKKTYQKVMNEANFREFYQLTEGQLSGINSQMIGYFDSKVLQQGWRMPLSKQLATMVASVVVIATGFVLVWQAQDIKAVDSDPMLLAVAEEVQLLPEELLNSQIPAYTEAASHQAIEVAQLSKSEQAKYAVNSEDDDYNAQLVVMDKVVVIPKTLNKTANKALVKPTAIAQKSALKSAKALPVVAKAIQSPAKIVAQGAYTIQIIASRNQQDIARFMKTHTLPATAKIMRSVRQGETWYVLALGAYPKRDDALHAVQKLPANVAALKPWIRPSSDLHIVG